MTPPRVVLVGAHGHGRGHLDQLAKLHAAGMVELAGVADPRPPCPEQRAAAADAPWRRDAASLIEALAPDLAVIVTPVHTHVELAEAAMRAGAHLLLEKPPAPSLAGLDRLLSVQAETGRTVQVGFQAFGSGAVTELRRRIDAGDLGDIEAISATGLWWRGEAYWNRAGWAGRRFLDGHDVNDGALTNPFAHAVALAVTLDGSPGDRSVRSVELDTYRTRPVEAHDTASARIRTAHGTRVTVAATLCAEAEEDPVVVVHGSRDTATLFYTQDRLVTAAGQAHHERTDLLENLLGHLADPSVPLLVPLAATRAFTEVAEAVRQSPPPTPVSEDHLSGTGSAGEGGLTALTHEAAATGRLYRELGIGWATAPAWTWTPKGS
ncbi:Gfo/Idh/MocA family oxidoreductase [Actinoplanes sichuanensis]|uniref:Gfo/Idh/MocA family protein n=1 Tax=Actinoplanes sichuanensis TaxID=512349 RepID=A0ABW4AU87_9ACTN|nr:Gfo/Idh/MocA family oxidoreductase [Actinoplanes sichuanensis]BEL04762.1 Gfo/Idh/MocA family oxidoreductase [Actinoplanes sichuanensis]